MTKRSFIQIDGVLYDKSQPLPEGVGRPQSKTASIMGDLPDFVSPIDGSVVNGRKGMREHCKQHNVVPTADLAGLPPKQMNGEYKPDRQAIRETIKQTIDGFYRK